MTAALVRLLAVVLHLAAADIGSQPLDLLWMRDGLPREQWSVTRVTAQTVEVSGSERTLLAELSSDLDATWLFAEVAVNRPPESRRPIALGVVSLADWARRLADIDSGAALTIEDDSVPAAWVEPGSGTASSSAPGTEGAMATDPAAGEIETPAVGDGSGSGGQPVSGGVRIRVSRSTVTVADPATGDTLVLALEGR